ncbi:hypothetical protein MCOR02_007982 [Pyricularia oryzae]|nr:hypothetical protein MCOR02_007982 [Pyricularia oryzae]
MSSCANLPERRSWWLAQMPPVPPPTTTTLWLLVAPVTGDTVAKLRVLPAARAGAAAVRLARRNMRPGPAVGRHDTIRDLNGRNEWTQKSTGLIQG